MGDKVGKREHVPFFLDLRVGKRRRCGIVVLVGEEAGVMLLNKKWGEAKILKATLAFEETGTCTVRSESTKSV